MAEAVDQPEVEKANSGTGQGSSPHLQLVPPLAPRLIRFRSAPFYVGMDRNRFNAEVRPYLTEIPIGDQGIAFDRLEIDAWVEQYKHRNGRPAQRKGVLKWDDQERQDSSSGKVSGISTSSTEADAFAKALAKVTSKKRKTI